MLPQCLRQIGAVAVTKVRVYCPAGKYIEISKLIYLLPMPTVTWQQVGYSKLVFTICGPTYEDSRHYPFNQPGGISWELLLVTARRGSNVRTEIRFASVGDAWQISAAIEVTLLPLSKTLRALVLSAICGEHEQIPCTASQGHSRNLAPVRLGSQ